MVSIKCKEILCLLYSGVLFLSGIFLIGFSVVLSYKLFYHFKFVPSDTMGPFVLIFGLGFVHLFLTWLGIKGPTKEHDFHIIMFIILCAALFFVETGTGIWGFAVKSGLGYKIEKILKESLSGYIKDDYDKKEWIILEMKLQCCGLYGFSDYKEKGSFPLSCCSNEVVPANVSCGKIHENGCMIPFTYYVDSLLLQIALTGLLSGLYQVLGVVAYYMFHKHLKAQRISRQTLRRQSRIYNGGNHQSMGSPLPPPPIAPPNT